jgi:hypothetical protein
VLHCGRMCVNEVGTGGLGGRFAKEMPSLRALIEPETLRTPRLTHRCGHAPARRRTLDLPALAASLIRSDGAANIYPCGASGLRMSKTVSSTTTAYAWDLSSAVPTLLREGSSTYNVLRWCRGVAR